MHLVNYIAVCYTATLGTGSGEQKSGKWPEIARAHVSGTVDLYLSASLLLAKLKAFTKST